MDVSAPPAPRPVTLSLPKSACRPGLTAALLVSTDVLAVLASVALAYWLRARISPLMEENQQAWLYAVAGLFPLAFLGAGLYRGCSLAEEMRAVFWRATWIWVGVIAATFLAREPRNADTLSRSVVIMAWVVTVTGVPMARILVRTLCAGRTWWGSPVLVLGRRFGASEVVCNLRNYPSRGVKPLGVLLCEDEPQEGEEIEGVPVVGRCGDVERYPTRWHDNRAVVALAGLDRDHQAKLVETARVFEQVALIPDFDFCSLWVAARDYGGMLGLHVKPHLFRLWPRFCKRFWDVVIAGIALLLLAPVFLAIGLAIVLTSPGPVFYSHMRLGRGGRFFRMWKFRSMVVDADRRLHEYLDAHPEIRAQWEEDQKLQDDPRITAVGKFLRRSSLDELPQLWNVLNGSMSLVGPRPVPDDGIEKFESYGPLYVEYYKAVRPGLSGLWQVSGRSDLAYDDRVKLDMRYIRNWSVWFDWEILLKTARAVFTGRGAW